MDFDPRWNGDPREDDRADDVRSGRTTQGNARCACDFFCANKARARRMSRGWDFASRRLRARTGDIRSFMAN
jgi:hypothetical protein